MTDELDTVAVVPWNELPPLGRWAVRDCTNTLHACYEVFDSRGRVIATLQSWPDRDSLAMAIETAAALSVGFDNG
jgi:hypothetical protein